ncbi:DNA-processing protein DprA [Tepidanaerobacter sp. GT38]|uniref:DNA-processing protein DprA n=1 Tax=Tepidanaerobacter sp. GT38 TaxID=2722793 RepID=UPI001F022F51|nr:DNA-processing protein DprA [Tepidanaerobacter sp. GT38]MCG1012419.1 DNA-processing protein DprA [Tepidanaerobacter sp. GT38]
MKEDGLLLVALNLIPDLGSLKIQSLAERFKSFSDFMKAKPNDLLEIPGIGEKICEKIIAYKSKIEPHREIEKAEEQGIRIITLFDEDYPEQLKQIYDPPPVLYIKGQRPVLDNNAIAIVGSRKASAYGRRVAINFAKELASMNINIVSGMARGIDSFAHKGAIDAGGPTTAVFGCGLDIVYPPENVALMQRIIECGSVISSFPLGVVPLPMNFPARNRIISGLALGTLVVEAAEKSGSLITAEFALEQGREVFAVPGNIFSPYSRGTHKLIKQGAKLVENTDDILDELYLERIHNRDGKEEFDLNKLSVPERAIFELIDYQPIQIEQLIEKTQSNSRDVNAILTRLELKGLIQALPGGYYVKN